MSQASQISTAQSDLFQARLSSQLNPQNPLITLSKSIDWDGLEASLGLTFSPHKAGQPAKPVRLMVGLMILQNMEGLSDEAVVEKWVENPYWQYFCGYDFLQWQFPIDPSSLVRWRKRLGVEGCEKILSATLQTSLTVGVAKEKDFSSVIADTTVQEADIAYPTDAKLLDKAREKLVDLAKSEDLKLRQSYAHVGKKMLRKVSGYAHAKQFKRMKKGIKKLKVYLGRVVRDIERKASAEQRPAFQELLALSNRLLIQTKTSKNKVYSLHAAHVYCMSKGKARKPYEFGTKVSLVITHKQGLALSSQALKTNQHDAHTLKDALENASTISDHAIDKAFVDRGYRGHKVGTADVYISGQKRGMTWSLKRALKRRSAIEPHIGHMKSDGKLGRCSLQGMLGAQLNALLSAIGHNFRLIKNHIKAFWAIILRRIIEGILKIIPTLQNQFHEY